MQFQLLVKGFISMLGWRFVSSLLLFLLFSTVSFYLVLSSGDFFLVSVTTTVLSSEPYLRKG